MEEAKTDRSISVH